MKAETPPGWDGENWDDLESDEQPEDKCEVDIASQSIEALVQRSLQTEVRRNLNDLNSLVNSSKLDQREILKADK